MSHIRASAVFSDIPGTICAISEILWRLPSRVILALLARTGDYFHSNDLNAASGGPPRSSVWLAIATSVFAPLLAHNWNLLLSRPAWGTDKRDGVLFPPDEPDAAKPEFRDEGTLARTKDQRWGFHGFVYASSSSPFYGQSTLRGADVVWLHAHGGGFYAGEARQYHYTYKRWVEKAYHEFGMDLRILAVEYPLSTVKPYPGCVDAMFSAYKFVLDSGTDASQVVIAGDSAGGNLAISTCYRIIENQSDPKLPSPAGLIMLSPWLDLTRATSGLSPNQPTDWLTTFDSDECKVGAIEQYMGTEVDSASDPRVSPLFRVPSPELPRQFLSAGKAEVLYADAEKWAHKVEKVLGSEAIERHFASGQVHTFAIGGWLADTGVVDLSDWRLLSFVHGETQGRGRNGMSKASKKW